MKGRLVWPPLLLAALGLLSTALGYAYLRRQDDYRISQIAKRDTLSLVAEVRRAQLQGVRYVSLASQFIGAQGFSESTFRTAMRFVMDLEAVGVSGYWRVVPDSERASYEASMLSACGADIQSHPEYGIGPPNATWPGAFSIMDSVNDSLVNMRPAPQRADYAVLTSASGEFENRRSVLGTDVRSFSWRAAAFAHMQETGSVAFSPLRRTFENEYAFLAYVPVFAPPPSLNISDTPCSPYPSDAEAARSWPHCKQNATHPNECGPLMASITMPLYVGRMLSRISGWYPRMVVTLQDVTDASVHYAGGASAPLEESPLEATISDTRAVVAVASIQDAPAVGYGGMVSADGVFYGTGYDAAAAVEAEADTEQLFRYAFVQGSRTVAVTIVVPPQYWMEHSTFSAGLFWAIGVLLSALLSGGLVLVLRWMSRLARAESRAAAAKLASVRAAQAAQERAVGMLAHELRNPLHAITATLELLVSRASLELSFRTQPHLLAPLLALDDAATGYSNINNNSSSSGNLGLSLTAYDTAGEDASYSNGGSGLLNQGGAGGRPQPPANRRLEASLTSMLTSLVTDLELVRERSDAMHRLINDMVDYTKLARGSFDLQPCEVRLRPMLERLVQSHKSFVNPGVKLTVQVAAEVPEYVYMDPVRLTQVLSNGLTNAAKVTASGLIAVTAFVIDGSANPALRGAGTRSGRFICFTSCDSGRGLAGVDVPALFEPFGGMTAMVDMHEGDKRGDKQRRDKAAAGGSGSGSGSGSVWTSLRQRLTGGRSHASNNGSGGVCVASAGSSSGTTADGPPSSRTGTDTDTATINHSNSNSNSKGSSNSNTATISRATLPSVRLSDDDAASAQAASAVSAAHIARQRGAGLGLPVARLTARAMGGDLDLYTETDTPAGRPLTRFLLMFPLEHVLPASQAGSGSGSFTAPAASPGDHSPAHGSKAGAAAHQQGQQGQPGQPPAGLFPPHGSLDASATEAVRSLVRGVMATIYSPASACAAPVPAAQPASAASAAPSTPMPPTPAPTSNASSPCVVATHSGSVFIEPQSLPARRASGGGGGGGPQLQLRLLPAAPAASDTAITATTDSTGGAPVTRGIGSQRMSRTSASSGSTANTGGVQVQLTTHGAGFGGAGSREYGPQDHSITVTTAGDAMALSAAELSVMLPPPGSSAPSSAAPSAEPSPSPPSKMPATDLNINPLTVARANVNVPPLEINSARKRDSSGSGSFVGVGGAGSSSSSSGSSRPLHLLYADDDAGNRKVMARMVERLGHTVTTVSDGSEALAALAAAGMYHSRDRDVAAAAAAGYTPQQQGQQYDAVLLDVHMRVLDGDEVAARLRAYTAWDARVPLVAVTASQSVATATASARSSTEDRSSRGEHTDSDANANLAVFDHLMPKPFTSAVLQDVLRGIARGIADGVASASASASGSASGTAATSARSVVVEEHTGIDVDLGSSHPPS